MLAENRDTHRQTLPILKYRYFGDGLQRWRPCAHQQRYTLRPDRLQWAQSGGRQCKLSPMQLLSRFKISSTRLLVLRCKVRARHGQKYRSEFTKTRHSKPSRSTDPSAPPVGEASFFHLSTKKSTSPSSLCPLTKLSGCVLYVPRISARFTPLSRLTARWVTVRGYIVLLCNQPPRLTQPPTLGGNRN